MPDTDRVLDEKHTIFESWESAVFLEYLIGETFDNIKFIDGFETTRISIDI